MIERLFYVRRHTGADGSFEWYVLNGHTRRRASNFFPTRAAAAAEREKLQTRLNSPRQKCSGERRKPARRIAFPLLCLAADRRGRVRPIGETRAGGGCCTVSAFPTINRLALPGHAAFC